MLRALYDSLLQSSTTQAAALVIVDSLLKGLVLLSLAWLAAFILRRSSSSLRHRLWIVALACTCILPLASMIEPRWKIILIDAGSRSQTTEVSVATTRSALIDRELPNHRM